MSRTFFALTLAALISAPAALVADTIPYPNVGTVPPTPTLTGLSKLTPPLEVDLTFVSAGSTNGIDTIRIYDVTHDYFSPYFFNSQTTRPGATQVFLATTQDVLVIFIHNSVTGLDLASDPVYSPDGITHAYVTKPPTGPLYVGMEDSPVPVSDLDYNDLTFTMTGADVSFATPTAVPESPTLVLLGTGVLSAVGIVRRRSLYVDFAFISRSKNKRLTAIHNDPPLFSRSCSFRCPGSSHPEHSLQ